jgi:hypothetical protein
MFASTQFEDIIEVNGWMGIIPVLLAAAVLRRHRTDPAVRQWTVIGLVFFVWALGPHLMAFGTNTAMILPQAFLRFIPIVNNVRFPGRAMVVVTLGLAALASVFLARWRPATLGRGPALALLAVGLVVESAPAPFPVVRLSVPRIYETLRDRPEAGAVCELPLGIRDGFGGRGDLNEMQFYYQTVHKRPLVGGYLSRLPKSVVAAYSSDPLVDALLNLSERAGRSATQQLVALPDASVARDRLHANGIAFVMLNRRLSPPALIDYVEKTMPLTLIESDEERSLYAVRGR